MSERMSEDRLVAIKHAYSGDVDTPEERQIIELLAEIDALRAELTAARTPPTSDELAETLKRVRFSCGVDTSDRVQRAFVRLEEAERERDSARADALEKAAKACETLTGSDATPTLRPGARMCLHRIRALKPTPTLGEQ